MFVKCFITSFAVHVQKRNYSLLRQIAERRVLLLPPRIQLIPSRTTACQVSNMQCKKCVKAVIHSKSTGSYFVSPIRDIDFNKPDLSDNTVEVKTGDLFNITYKPMTWNDTLKVSDFRYVKRVTMREAMWFSADFYKGQTDSDGETSEDDAKDFGYEGDGNKYLSDSDIEMSEEKFL